MTALVDRQATEIAARLDPEPGPAEALFVAYVFAGMAAWLAWARLWRWW